ncbi:MAG: nitrile hydratase subunit alpha [Crocinitomicaceae bacterium]
MISSIENRKKLVGIIAKAWLDSSFKADLIEDPRKVMTEAGIAIDGDYKIDVVKNDKSETNIVIDSQPLPVSEEIGLKDLPPNPNFHQANTYIYQKCATDKVYRTHFIHNAEACFEDIGFYLPKGHNLVVRQNTPDKKYFVLPVKPEGTIETESLQNEISMFQTAGADDPVSTDVATSVVVDGSVQVLINAVVTGPVSTVVTGTTVTAVVTGTTVTAVVLI